MHALIVFFFLEVKSYPLVSAMYVFIAMLCTLLFCTLGFILSKRRIDKIQKQWTQPVATLVSTSVFYTAKDLEYTDVVAQYKELLLKSSFRGHLINEIIFTRKELSGSSAENLKAFYNAFELNKDSFKKLQSNKWHIKAKGIQELAVMEQKQYSKEIFALTNDNNKHVRNEAQCALVNFYGFAGLKFLSETHHPVSEWQQIQLLNKLSGTNIHDSRCIREWLTSANESIVAFSLKLATFYNCFDLYEDVMTCLKSKNVQVKLGVIYYLEKNAREDSAERLVHDYAFDNKIYKLAILNIIKEIGNEKQFTFLFKQLHHADHDIKAAAAKALSYLHPSGNVVLQNHLFADENPWQQIFLQIEKDHAA
jgi:hypothetical protein